MTLKLFAVFLAVCAVGLTLGGRTKRVGTCPPATGIAHCAVVCEHDFDCKRGEKCCYNGCGYDCMLVKETSRGNSCKYEGLTYDKGKSFKVKCNTCCCRRRGKLQCTSRECSDKLCQTGLKPKRNVFCGGIAGVQCPKPLQCDMSNAPPNSADYPGLCCKACPRGLTTLPFTHCSAKRSCPNGYTCEYPNKRAKKGLCCIDCRGVKCAKPDCLDHYVPAGKCCPTCKKPCNVSGTIYQSGESFYIECNRCSCNDGVVPCTKIGCPEGCFVNGTHYEQRDVIPSEDPCELCKCVLERGVYKIRCKPIICEELRCPNTVIPEGKCCPECVDCFKVECPQIKCARGYIPQVPSGECCPTCVKDCSTVLCLAVVCEKGQVSYTPPDQCCPKCKPDCSKVLCALIRCQPGYVSQTPPGECCPECFLDVDAGNCPSGTPIPGHFCGRGGQPCPANYYCNISPVDAFAVCCHCSTIICALPFCPPGYALQVPKGECCPVCVKGDCTYNGQVYSAGDTFPDECNTCTCEEDGSVACTELFCGGCTYNDQYYDVGESFPVDCNKCSCQEGGSVICTLIACEDGCKYNGQTYSVGETFPIECNTCTCLEGGGVVCTLIACGCLHKGQWYSLGEEFTDDCNNCTCLEGGLVVCTKIFCGECTFAGQYVSVGDTFSPDGCNTCTCTLGGESACTERACLCENGFSPLPNDTCGGNAELQCQTDGYECDFSNLPSGVSDPNAFGMCCKAKTCTNLMLPLSDTNCGGFPGFPCPKGYGCDYSNVLPNIADAFGVCCKLYQCQNGRKPLSTNHCGKDRPCPKGFKCEYEDDEDDVGFCCLDCSFVKCGTPVCDDPIVSETECCDVCPEEPCIVNEEIYESGETFYDECNRCNCFNGAAACTRKGCLPGCYREGKHYADGVEVPTDDPCEHCTCFLNENEYEIICDIQDCARPPCNNPTFIDGQCCPVCTVEGCTDDDGTFYKFGENVPRKDPCLNCLCSQDTEIICTSASCAVECDNPEFVEGQCCPVCPEGCVDDDGTFHSVGYVLPDDDPCSECICTENGAFECTQMSCAIYDPCFNQMTPTGECCPVCDTSTCQRYGITIYPGPPVDVDGCCECTCIYGETHCDCDDECP